MSAIANKVSLLHRGVKFVYDLLKKVCIQAVDLKDKTQERDDINKILEFVFCNSAHPKKFSNLV